MTKTKQDLGLFKQAMKHVKPLKHRKLAEIQKPPKEKRNNSMIENREAASDWFIDQAITCQPNEMLFFAHPGIQHRTLKSLKQGKLSIQATLDLHGTTLSMAYDQLHTFIEQCQTDGRRRVLIIHGKGTAKLKSAIDTWLREHPSTLAFSSAVPSDGGAGALYLLLRNIKK